MATPVVSYALPRGAQCDSPYEDDSSPDHTKSARNRGLTFRSYLQRVYIFGPRLVSLLNELMATLPAVRSRTTRKHHDISFRDHGLAGG
jgi:hypothetical protein